MSARLAVSLAFALNGFVFGSLYARMPALRDGLGLSNGELGLALVAITAALVATAIPAGALITRAGSGAVVVAGALVALSGLVLAGFAGSFASFAGALAVYGAGAALVDVAMNVKGLAVEQTGSRRIFGSLHAAFSGGALVATVVAAAAAAAGLGPGEHFLIAATAGIVALAAAARPLQPEQPGEERGGQAFAWPTRGLAIVGVVAFCALLAEGSISDWGAIFLHDEHATSEATAAIGLGVFSITMALGRLAADPLSERFGSRALIRAGGVVGVVAMAALLLAPSPELALAALLVLGIGAAPLFPMTLRAAGTRGPSMAFATGAGYTGLMTGPPVIGALAELASLPAALLLVVAACVVAAALAPAGARD